MKGWVTFLLGVAVGWLVVPHLVPIFKMTEMQFLGQLQQKGI